MESGKKKKLVRPETFTNPLCAEVSPEFFFTNDIEYRTKSTMSVSDYRIGKSICSKCEHIIDCAEWGIHNEDYGLWGGLTPEDRKNIRRKRKITIRDSE